MIAKRFLHKCLIGCFGGLLLLGTAFADVRVVLDVSKSMAENDPQNTRSDAIMMLLNTLPNGEKAGIWTFGQYVNLLVPHEVVSDRWRAEAKAKITQLSAPAIRTNLGRALEEASYDFLFSTYRAPTHVILITDGRVDIAPNSDVNDVERERILSQLVPKYAAANARIHTVAISNEADQSLLRQLSEQTGGRFQKVENPSTLTRVLADLSAIVSPTNQLKMVRESFMVDGSVRELTVWVPHSQGAISLVAPNGEETSAVQPGRQRWRVGSGFTQVSISSPQMGQWRVKGELLPNASVQVLSDATLVWTKPETTMALKGSVLRLEAMLVDTQGNSVAPDLTALVEAELKVDGAPSTVLIEGDKLIGRVVAPANADVITVELSVNGGTFNRLLTRQLQFAEPYISEVILTAEGYEWRLYPNQLLMGSGTMDVQAQWMDEGMTKTEPFVQAEAGYWVWKLPYTAKPGTYDVQLQGDMHNGMDKTLLSKQVIALDVPPKAGNRLAMTPEAVEAVTPAMPMVEDDSFTKDPMPVFEELQADLVVDQGQWSDEQPASDQDSGKWLTYALLSLPGVLVLVVAYLFYRRLEQKTKGQVAEEELILGGDEFSELDDLGAIKPDSDLDISSLDDMGDDSLPDAPVIDEIYEEELPPPQRTEAPSIAQEDMLDSESSTGFDEVADTEEDPEEELFDISSIDDDLADLDLALDGDDPFADDEPEEKN